MRCSSSPGLSIQDPRERPRTCEAAAGGRGDTGGLPTSDFASYLNLGTTSRTSRMSSPVVRSAPVQEQYLHYLRVREWQDLHAPSLVMACNRTHPQLTKRDSSVPAVGTAFLSVCVTWRRAWYIGARGRVRHLRQAFNLAVQSSRNGSCRPAGRNHPGYGLNFNAHPNPRVWFLNVLRCRVSLQLQRSPLGKRGLPQWPWKGARSMASTCCRTQGRLLEDR